MYKTRNISRIGVLVLVGTLIVGVLGSGTSLSAKQDKAKQYKHLSGNHEGNLSNTILKNSSSDDSDDDDINDDSKGRKMGQDKERKLQNNPSSQRVNKLLKNLAQIEKRIRNIENSRMRATVKARYLAMLERNRVMILNQIGALNQTGSTTDTTAPIITTLSVSSITSQRATLSAIVNENGIGYWVVLPSGSVAPSATQVQNGQNASGIMVSLRGVALTYSGTNTLTMNGLVANTSYVVYMTTRDLRGNLQPSVSTVAFSTPATGSIDVTPPLISALTVSNTTSTGTRLNVSSNEPGTGYYVVLPSGSVAPSVAQIRAGQNASGINTSPSGSAPIIDGTTQLMVNGLTANTTYVAYLVAVDTSGNTTAAVMSIAFITLVVPDTTAPTITSLSLSGTTASGTSIVASINESGTGYYVVLPSGSVAPSATQIRAGQNAGGVVVAIKGSASTIVGTTTFPITGLSASTAYLIFFTAADASGNLQGSPSVIGITTPAL